MIKHFFKAFFAITIIFAALSLTVCAQDTTKKIAPAKANPTTPKAVYHKPAAPVLSPAADSAQKAQMDPSQLNDKSLNGQYQYLLTKVFHYQQPLIAALWKNAMDTLRASKDGLKAAQAKLGSQTKVVDSLKTTVTTKDQSLNESNSKADALSVFGMMVSKSNYNVIMLCLVGGLAAALTIVIITTAKHKNEARHRTELYEEIEEEYKTFKAKAHEKELKLARELQTERNKLDDLLGKG
jgi:hypothetical protein